MSSKRKITLNQYLMMQTLILKHHKNSVKSTCSLVKDAKNVVDILLKENETNVEGFIQDKTDAESVGKLTTLALEHL